MTWTCFLSALHPHASLPSLEAIAKGCPISPTWRRHHA